MEEFLLLRCTASLERIADALERAFPIRTHTTGEGEILYPDYEKEIFEDRLRDDYFEATGIRLDRGELPPPPEGKEDLIEE